LVARPGRAEATKRAFLGSFSAGANVEKQWGSSRALEAFAHKATEWTGHSSAFLLALLVIVAWGLSGPYFGYSDTWQLVINTGTTIVTFLMVFLIQRTQNKDAKAIHLKLNEILRAMHEASNRLIDAEDLTEEEIEALHLHYHDLANHFLDEREKRRAP
jgi:low affinity Fe/Cu permease